LAAQLVSALSAKFDSTKFMDTYREQVLDLIQKKARGERIVGEPAPVEARVIDLMSALKSSLESVGAGVDRTSLARPEIVERAGSADISGHSKMSEDEPIVRSGRKPRDP
jgi:DNA end-binding protein Ku